MMQEQKFQNSLCQSLHLLPCSDDVSSNRSIQVSFRLGPRQCDRSRGESCYHWSSRRIGYIYNKKIRTFFILVTSDISSWSIVLQLITSYKEGNMFNLSREIRLFTFRFVTFLSIYSKISNVLHKINTPDPQIMLFFGRTK